MNNIQYFMHARLECLQVMKQAIKDGLPTTAKAARDGSRLYAKIIEKLKTGDNSTGIP